VTYDEAIEWLLSFADFERSGRFQDRPDVAPMLSLLERLGNPHLGRPTVHIAGSKGKGSVAAMIARLLAASGRWTGLYTSPHLHSYTERIVLDGDPISEQEFAQIVEQDMRPVVGGVHGLPDDRQLVTFDLITALAFLAFRESKYGQMEAQVIEVGLGGRVDSTNVFDTKEVAVITPISLEHRGILGNTVEEIAREKAAIITPGCGVVMAPQTYPEAKRVILEFADAARASVLDVRDQYRWRRLSHDRWRQRIRIEGPKLIAANSGRELGYVEANLPLLGSHQIENAATALAAAVSLPPRDEPLNTVQISGALETSYWPCRIEVLREDPLVIVDGAHNRDSARRLAETLVEYFACDRAVFVIGCGSDKDVEGLAEELAPLASRVLAVRSEHPRAMEPQRIQEAFGRLGVDSENVDNVPAAVDTAIAAARSGALICVAGSLFVAAEARAHVLGVGT
jgi:dihydrofolate synthase/folylpolyglutamate synthase